MIKPKMDSPSYQLELSDGKSKKAYGFLLDGDNAIQQDILSEDQFAAFIRSTNKKFGEFDEQKNWKSGRGIEYFNINPEGFWDSKDCWTLTPGHLTQTLQYKFAKGMRSQDFNMPGSVMWKPLFAGNRYLDVSFSASASYSVANCWMWIKRVGSPGTLTVELCSNSGGNPDTVLKTMTVTTSTATDIVSVLHNFAPSSVQAVTASTTYHVKIYGAATDTKSSHWEVGCDAATAGLNSTAGSSWAATTFSPYYRLTDADINRRLYGFIYDSCFYVVDSKDSGAASQLWMNGDRGKLTSSTSTVLTDSNSGLYTSWTTNMWAGAWIKIIRGTGRGQVRQIASNTGTAITVSTAFGTTPDNTSEYAIYSTDRFVEVTGHGLGRVVSQPVFANRQIFFPQGASVFIRTMAFDATIPGHLFVAETTYADFLEYAHDFKDGVPYVWRALVASNTISKATVADFGTGMSTPGGGGSGASLTFGSAIKVGDATLPITGIKAHGESVWIFKEDGPWEKVYRETISGGNTVTVERCKEHGIGMRSTPSAFNGLASTSHNLDLIFSWLWSTERLHGTTLDDIGQDWGGSGMPDGRHGNVAQYESVIGWLFAAIDAGTGTSSVMCFDNQGWHEILRGFSAGRRIRGIKWQPCEGARNRLWTFIGGEPIYQEFPYNTAAPLRDSGVLYQHEGVLESSVIDMGAASRLPKYINNLTALSKNLSDAGMYIGVDYQVDDDVHTSNWNSVQNFSVSPEDVTNINKGNLRQFAYRLRLNTDNNTIPVDIKAVVPSGFARVPYRKIWNVRIKTGGMFDKNGGNNISQEDLLEWLDEAASFPGRITMTSIYSYMNDKSVIVSPPKLHARGVDKGILVLSIMEI